MSNHKTPLTKLEKDGLIAHGLGRHIGKPSQLADVFRQGVAWALAHHPAPTQQPLTVTGCSYCLNKTAYKLTPTCTECGHDMLTATKLESAHGITGSKT